MTQRLNFFQASPKAMDTIMNMESYLTHCHKDKKSLSRSLIELVELRVSQINGCAYCLDMHSKNARSQGETEQRLYALSAWRETNFYTPQEQAALAWAEAHTLIHQQGIEDALYEQVSAEFNDEQLVDLTLLIGTINTWNRFAIGFKSEPGSYSVGDFEL